MYPKIQTVFKRDPDTNFKTLLYGEYSVPEFEYLAGNQWVFTEKVDGTNIRIGLQDVEGRYRQYFLGGRTDRAQIPAPLVEYIHALGLREKLPEHFDGPVMLYGEGYGGSIQKAGATYGNPQRFVLFDVKVGDYWLDRENVNDVAQKLRIASVPVIGRGALAEAMSAVKSGLRSTWGEFEAEGLVCRPVVPMFTRHGERVIVKVKAKDLKR